MPATSYEGGTATPGKKKASNKGEGTPGPTSSRSSVS